MLFREVGVVAGELWFGNDFLKKNYEKQKLVTDSGIEISVPVHLLADKQCVEFGGRKRQMVCCDKKCRAVSREIKWERKKRKWLI